MIKIDFVEDEIDFNGFDDIERDEDMDDNIWEDYGERVEYDENEEPDDLGF